MTDAYLSLGSNLGGRVANLRASIKELGKLGDVTGVSSFYETEPMDMHDQPWFVNCVVKLETSLSAEQLLSGVHEIETRLGRNRVIAKGPRTVDIDLVLFGSHVIRKSNLQVPHPAMHLRRFVLIPLAEIAPDVVHPVLQSSGQELLLKLKDSEGIVRRLSS